MHSSYNGWWLFLIGQGEHFEFSVYRYYSLPCNVPDMNYVS